MTYPTAAEFDPLPWYPWDSRPSTTPLTIDEVATALFLDHGKIDLAAARLKVAPRQVKKLIKQTPKLQTLLTRLVLRVNNAILEIGVFLKSSMRRAVALWFC